ncbi:hypothetical protein ACVWZ4_004331 [Bradyrhizobium sp. USDA 4472]
MRDKLRLRAEECFQQSASQICVMPVTFKGLDTLLLARNILLATQQVALSLL